MSEFVFLYRNGDRPPSPEQVQQVLQKWGAWFKDLADKGHMVDRGQPLDRSGKLVSSAKVVTDGPFAEAKEIIGGFWIWQVSSMEEAVEWLKRAPFRDQLVDLRKILEPADLEGQLPQEVLDSEARLRAQSAATPGE